MKKPTQQIIIDALYKNYGVLTTTAASLGCVRQTLKKWIDANEKLTEEFHNSQKTLEDLCKTNLIKNIKEGKEASIFFTLKTKFGYKETTDPLITLNNNSVKINYIEPTNNKSIEGPTINIEPKKDDE